MARPKSRPGPRAILANYCLSLALLGITLLFFWKESPVDPAGRLPFQVFFIIGVVWFLGALYYTMAWLAHGDVRLQVLGPVYPGGRLVAVVRVPKLLVGARTLRATLRCMEVYRGEPIPKAWYARPILERSVWSIKGGFPVVTRGRTSECRIEFDVPADALLTTGSVDVFGNPIPGSYWDLAIYADVPGIDLVRSFPVRVGLAPAARGMPPSQRETV
jgi:hypothetical protein